MDYQFALDFLHQHKDAGYLVLGAILSHPLLLADAFFAAVSKTPFKHVIFKLWPQIKDFLDKFEDRFGQDVAAEQAKETPAAAPEQPAALPPAAKP